MSPGISAMAGAMVSSTVTEAVAEAELVARSTPVRVTVTAPPRSSQSKSLMSRLRLSSPLQSSYEPSSISAGLMLAAPDASRYTVMSWVRMTGAVTSMTATLKLVVAMLPAMSTTVRVTVVTRPASSQSKSVMSKYIVSIPMLSVAVMLPPSKSRVALPSSSRYRVVSEPASRPPEKFVSGSGSSLSMRMVWQLVSPTLPKMSMMYAQNV